MAKDANTIPEREPEPILADIEAAAGLVSSGPTFPTLVEVGRQLAVTEADHHALDRRMVENKANAKAVPNLDRTMALLSAREAALRNLIITLPAKTLGDAAVQVGVAKDLINDLVSNESTPEEAAGIGRCLMSVAVSVLPVLVAASKLDVGMVNWLESLFPRADSPVREV